MAYAEATSPDAIEQKIAECWANGMGLRETRTALERLGIRMEREAIRLRFVALAEEWR